MHDDKEVLDDLFSEASFSKATWKDRFDMTSGGGEVELLELVLEMVLIRCFSGLAPRLVLSFLGLF